MVLGETIHRLRGERKLSQGDLAELLDVSRQSVSRWETGSAVPELEKLVKLSEIFGVTLDELVHGEAPPREGPEEASAPEAPSQPAERSFPTRKIVGTILLCMGFLVALLLTVLGSFLSGLFFASPFLLCGAVCFLFRRRVGLWCGWAVLLAGDLYLRWATSVTWRLVWLTAHFEPSMNYTRLAMAWCQVALVILFVLLTVFLYRKERFELSRRSKRYLAGGWAMFLLLALFIKLPVPSYSRDLWRFFAFFQLAYDWARLALFMVLLVITLCSRRRSAPASP